MFFYAPFICLNFSVVLVRTDNIANHYNREIFIPSPIASAAMLNPFMPRRFLLNYIIRERYIIRISIESTIDSCPNHLLKVNLEKRNLNE